jgi:hypothetical protein
VQRHQRVRPGGSRSFWSVKLQIDQITFSANARTLDRNFFNPRPRPRFVEYSAFFEDEHEAGFQAAASWNYP